MKYKVGDKVRVKKDLRADDVYSKWKFTFLMEQYKGKLATVIGVNISDKCYYLDIDEGMWGWTDEMLEDVETEYNIQNDDITITLKQSEIIISGCKKFEIAVTKDGFKCLFDGKEVEHVD